jgi:hypothetical protein
MADLRLVPAEEEIDPIEELGAGKGFRCIIVGPHLVAP